MPSGPKVTRLADLPLAPASQIADDHVLGTAVPMARPKGPSPLLLRAPPFTPIFPALLQVRAAGDFESYLSFGVGLSQRAGFSVFTLARPYRVVIDVVHAGLPPFPGIWDITTWTQFWETQVAFNQGHQPWRGNPRLVVQAWAAGNMVPGRLHR